MTEGNFTELKAATLIRRIGALFYDGLLVLAVIFFAGMLVLPLLEGKPNILYYFYLFIVVFVYFAWQWRLGGQTLGMAAWGIEVQTLQGGYLSWRQGLIRFSVAIIAFLAVGIGFFWALSNPKRQAWHDLASDSWVVYIPPNKR